MRVIDVTEQSHGSSEAQRVQEASAQLVRELKEGPPLGGVLIPGGGPAGYHYTHLTETDGRLLRRSGRSSTPPPQPELLDALKGLGPDRRAILIPEIYSPVLNQTVRVAVILPKNYDRNQTKESRILKILPKGGVSIASLIQGAGLDAIDKRLAKMFDKWNWIVAIPELPTEKNGLEAALIQDIEPYLASAFSAEIAFGPGLGFEYPSMQIISATVLEPRKRAPQFSPVGPSSPPHSTQSPGTRPPGRFTGLGSPLGSGTRDYSAGNSSYSDYSSHSYSPPPKLSLKERLEKEPDGIVACRYGEVVVDTLDKRSRASKVSSTSAPPTGSDLEGLQRRAGQLPIIARIASPVLDSGIDYAIILPPNFDMARKPPYKLEAVLPPVPGPSLNALVRDVLASPPTPDTIRIIPEPDPEGVKIGSQHVLRALVEGEILGRITDAYNVTLDGYSVLELPMAESEHRVVLAENRSKPAELPRAHVSSGGEWKTCLPTFGDSPSCAGAKGTEIIPASLQKVGDDRGGFFMPVIRSNALGKDVRAGVYLPPGYDPASGERYPVLFLLPGRKNPLSSWLVAGGAIPKLDRMMSADAQKMIVVIADNTDSYFVNSQPKETGYLSKTITPRAYQDHLMKELVAYATDSLKGDRDRMSLGGISRGAFGAFVAAGEHGGVFKAVASYSGLVGSERYAGKESDSPDEADRDGPNPARLALTGAFSGERAPRIYVEVGADDKHVADDATEFSAILHGKGASIEYHRFASSSAGSIGHDWDLWRPRFEAWIAWHQSTFGEAGVPLEQLDANDVSQAALTTFWEGQAAKWAAEDPGIERMREMVQKLGDVARNWPEEDTSDLPPWIKSDDVAAIVSSHGAAGSLMAAAERVMGLRDKEPFTDLHQQQLRDASGRLVDLGRQMDSLKKQIHMWRDINPAHRTELEGLFVELPEARDALIDLLGKRPELFAGEDAVNKKRFATQLVEHVQGGFVKPEEARGFAEFLRRIATWKWTYREGGYSHANCATMVFALNHPGVLLDMIEAAKSDRHYPLFAGWAGFEEVGAKTLEPRVEFKTPWASATVSTGSSFTSGFATTSEATGYEKGFIRALKDSIAPKATDNPKSWKAGRCDPIAFALSRVAGHDYRYGYAYDMKTGADLAEAVQSQTGEGWIAMSDVTITLPSGRESTSHFPVFYDYDPVSRTIAMQDFSDTTGGRVSIDGLKLKDPAIYYMDVPEIQKFLTPDQQKVAPASTGTDYRWNENADLLGSFGDGAKILEKNTRMTPSFASDLNAELVDWEDREVAIRIHHRPSANSGLRTISATIKASDFTFPATGQFEFNHKKIWTMDLVKVEFGDPSVARPKGPDFDEFEPFGSEATVIERDPSKLSEPFRKAITAELEKYGEGEAAVRFHITPIGSSARRLSKTVAAIVKAKDLRAELLETSDFHVRGQLLYAFECDKAEIAAPSAAKKKAAPQEASTDSPIGTKGEEDTLPPFGPSARSIEMGTGKDFSPSNFLNRVARAVKSYGDKPIAVRIHYLEPGSSDATLHTIAGITKASELYWNVTSSIHFKGRDFGGFCRRVEIIPAASLPVSPPLPPATSPAESTEAIRESSVSADVKRRVEVRIALARHFSLKGETRAYEGLGSDMGLRTLILRLCGDNPRAQELAFSVGSELGLDALRMNARLGPLSEVSFQVLERNLVESDLRIL